MKFSQDLLARSQSLSKVQAMTGYSKSAWRLILGLALLAWIMPFGTRGATSPAAVRVTTLGPVQFSIAGGVYATNLSVALTAPSPSAEIHFTSDGSTPNEQSPRYTEPISIGTCVVLKARAFQAGALSPVTCQTYTLVDDSLAQFSSNLPLILIDTFGRQSQRESKELGSVRIIAPGGGGRAEMTGTAEVDTRARINLRGHSSLRYPKRSYRLKLLDAEDQPLKATLFGFPKDSDWVLYAPYPDKTLMRDVLAYEISNQMGRYAPRTRFVELFVNVAGQKLSQRQYMGIYVLEEKIKRAKERVPLQKLSPEDNEEPAISGGYIFKKDHLDRVEVDNPNIGGFPSNGTPSNSNREGFPTGPGGFPGDPKGFLPTEGRGDLNMPSMMGGTDRLLRNGEGFLSPHHTSFLYVEPSATEITLAQRRWLSQDIRKLEAALYGPEFRDPVKGYAAFLDADSFIDYHWLVEATKNIDGFRFSTFYFKDREGKVQMGPIWDWNLSFGAANGKQGYMAEHWYWPQLDDQQYSWFRRLFDDPDFGQKYVDRWGTLRTNQFATPKILARIDELTALLNEAQARNFRRWRILSRQVWPQYYTGKTYADEVQYLKSWITQRLTWIDHQFVAGPSYLFQAATTPDSGRLILRAATGKILYTTDGTDPRAPGGLPSTSAQAYKAGIALTGKTVVFARVLEGKRWSWPIRFAGPGL